VSVNNRCHELTSLKVADGSGNSLNVSGVITYRVVDSARAALDMDHLESYVKVQAHAVLKRIASRFPYVTYDGSPSLMTEQAALNGQLTALLQEKTAVAGVSVISFELADLAYADSIAPQMLVRQQAQAILDARKTIVAGAVGIVADALEGLKDRGHEVVGEESKQRIVGNLMTVLCSEKSPVPTVRSAAACFEHLLTPPPLRLTCEDQPPLPRRNTRLTLLCNVLLLPPPTLARAESSERASERDGKKLIITGGQIANGRVERPARLSVRHAARAVRPEGALRKQPPQKVALWRSSLRARSRRAAAPAPAHATAGGAGAPV
jgi:SPFH domain / Band 7 family